MSTFLFVVGLLSAQYNISSDNGTTAVDCGGTFTDSDVADGTKGSTVGDYGDGEDYVFTICPDNPGDVVRLTFSQMCICIE